jgi:hypothetical protein
MTDYIEKAEGSAIVKKYTAQSQAVVEHAKQIKILTDGDMAPVADFLAEIGKAKATIKDELDPIISDAHGVHKRLTTMRTNMLAPYEDAERLAKGKISSYMAEQEQKRREEQARLDREAKEREEKERQKLLEKAAKAEEKGQTEKAADLLDRAESAYVPAPVLQDITRSVKTENGGISGIRDIEIVSINPRRFIAAVIAGTAPINAVEIKATVVKRWVKDFGIAPQQLAAAGITVREVFQIRNQKTA